MKKLIALLIIGLFAFGAFAGCVGSGDDSNVSDTMTSTSAPSATGSNKTPQLTTLIDTDWTVATTTPSVFVVDDDIGDWSLPSGVVRMWVNITLFSEGATVFASNGAYQGPGQTYQENYDQDAFNGGNTDFVVGNPPAGDWYALYRHATQEPASSATGHLTVTILA
ncbi:MAG: hypothetical protein CVT48_01620 [Thermoplasmata archaeon HGW-Thermoplasmata-1]|nr:MAG: hypothetical protein CVT48_01620 [Thermoplasmata archaeon HGW-Thermoplasmata-1]